MIDWSFFYHVYIKRYLCCIQTKVRVVSSVPSRNTVEI